MLKKMVLTEKALRSMTRSQIRLLRKDEEKPAAGSFAKAAIGEKTNKS